MPNRKIAIDCDGVVANFTKAYLVEAKALFPTLNIDVDYLPTAWDDFGPLSGPDQSAVWKHIRKTDNWWLRCLEPYRENMQALGKALYVKKNVDFYIVTSRAETTGMTTAMQTRAWLSACGVLAEYNYLGVIAVARWEDKRNIYKAMQIDGSIDDKKETVEDCDGLTGHEAYLLDRPWNQDANVKRRVFSLDTFLARW